MKNLILVLVGVSIILGAMLFYNSAAVEDLGINTKAQQPASINPQVSVEAKINSTPTTALEQITEQVIIADTTIKKHKRLTYDDDWCLKSELVEADEALAEKEIQAWNASIGDFKYNIIDPRRGYIIDNENPDESTPYLSLSDEALFEYIDAEDPYAMFVALDRLDFKPKVLNEIAIKLLTMGYTGKAISYLVMAESSSAKVSYSHGGNVFSDEVRHHVIESLVYTKYALGLHDGTGLGVLRGASYRRKGNEIDYSTDLTESDYNKVDQKVRALQKYIEVTRNQKGLPPVERELTKIAKQQLDYDIGTSVGDVPSLEFLVERFSTSIPELEINNKCQKELIALYRSVD